MTICHRTAAHRKSVSPGRRGAIAKPPFHSAAPMEVHGCLDKQACSYGANAGYAYDEFDGYIYDESLIGFDRETNLHDNWHRTYDPLSGRYNTADLLGLAGGDLSPYIYSRSNPLSFTDPRGLEPSYFGVGQAYAQAQFSAMKQYLQYQLTTAGIALGILSAPPTVAAAPAVANSTVRAVMSSRVTTMCLVGGANPRVQQGIIDFTTSLFPGTPAMSVPGGVGGVIGSQTNPQETLR